MTDRKNRAMTYYLFIMIAFAIIGVTVIIRIFVIVFYERDYWKAVANRFVKENIVATPMRGNIFSDEGKLMASSLPEYALYLDFQAGGKKKDSILVANLTTISKGLHKIFPDKSEQYFRNHLQQGRKKRKRYYRIYPGKATYLDYKKVRELPVFNLNKNIGGFIAVADNKRKKPFGSLAARTLGDVYASKDSARSGLEYSFDKQLRGIPGVKHRKKVKNFYLEECDIPAVDGYNIQTTLNVDIQDITEKALRTKLEEIEAELGIAVVMDVKTGDVKAISNLSRNANGQYSEWQNNAVSSLMEPGSTFKTASLMVALEDGKITPETLINTGNGIMPMHGEQMKDHNWRRGGYQVITAQEALMYSSNIGVAHMIDSSYMHNPQQFVDGLKRIGITEQLDLQITGSPKPNIRGPKDGKYFAGTTLPWMSIGYETQIPPINVLTFYNAIANNGKMVKPRFVTRVFSNDEVVETFPVEVIREEICSQKTLEQIRTMLRLVVEKGTGKPAGCKQFAVAGKTGTAQINYGVSEQRMGHLVSFCGYFPADNPKYSCIVSVKNPHKGYPSGGLISGAVFSRIAERIYARELRLDIEEASDSASVMVPDVLSGYIDETLLVLDELDIDTDYSGSSSSRSLGYATIKGNNIELTDRKVIKGLMPNVHGLGARDAVYLLEQCGLYVRLSGVGKVKRQSIPSGNRIRKGQTVHLTLGH